VFKKILLSSVSTLILSLLHPTAGSASTKTHARLRYARSASDGARNSGQGEATYGLSFVPVARGERSPRAKRTAAPSGSP
jgi:hypothetical protein